MFSSFGQLEDGQSIARLQGQVKNYVTTHPIYNAGKTGMYSLAGAGGALIGSTVFTNNPHHMLAAGAVGASLPLGWKGAGVGIGLTAASYLPHKADIATGIGAVGGGIAGYSIASHYGGGWKGKAAGIAIGALEGAGIPQFIKAHPNTIHSHPHMYLGGAIGAAVGYGVNSAKGFGVGGRIAGAAVGMLAGAGTAGVMVRAHEHGTSSVAVPALGALGIAFGAALLGAGGLIAAGKAHWLEKIVVSKGLSSVIHKEFSIPQAAAKAAGIPSFLSGANARGVGALEKAAKFMLTRKYPSAYILGGLAVWGGATAIHEGVTPPEIEMAREAREMNGGISHDHMGSGGMALASHYAMHKRIF